MCLINNGNIENILKTHKNLVNSISSANILKESIVTEPTLENGWLCCFRGYIPKEVEDPFDIQSGKAFLRVNQEKKVIYTVKKTKSYYIFKAFISSMCAENKRDIKFSLLSQWCIRGIPNILSFGTIKPGVSLEYVTTIDPSFRFHEKDNKGYSTHVFADRNGSIASICYEKNQDGKFYVKNIRWTSEGRNILPYLLPIDRQLMDPNYTPCEDRKDIEGSCCMVQ